MEETPPTRRMFLKASGAAGAVGVAGCSMQSDGSDDSTDNTDDNTDDAAAAGDPGQRVAEFYDAAAAIWTDYFHSETAEEPYSGVSTTTVETGLDSETLADYVDLPDSVTSTVAAGSETAIVEATAELTDGPTMTEMWALATENGEWQLVAEADEPDQSEQTGEESTSQVANNVNVTSAVGTVNDAGDGITAVRLTVNRGPGSGDIDLSEVTVSYVGDNGFANLTHASAGGENAYYLESVVSETADPVITDDGDRYQIIVPFGSTAVEENLAAADPTADAEPVTNDGLAPLAAGGEAEIEIVTADGAAQHAFISAPDTLTAGERVTLR